MVSSRWTENPKMPVRVRLSPPISYPACSVKGYEIILINGTHDGDLTKKVGEKYY
jgi:hypothetical protein